MTTIIIFESLKENVHDEEKIFKKSQISSEIENLVYTISLGRFNSRIGTEGP